MLFPHVWGTGLAYHADRMTLSEPARAPAARRSALFWESSLNIAENWALGLTWAMSPKRIAGIPGLTKLCFD